MWTTTKTETSRKPREPFCNGMAPCSILTPVEGDPDAKKVGLKFFANFFLTAWIWWAWRTILMTFNWKTYQVLTLKKYSFCNEKIYLACQDEYGHLLTCQDDIFGNRKKVQVAVRLGQEPCRWLLVRKDDHGPFKALGQIAYDKNHRYPKDEIAEHIQII